MGQRQWNGRFRSLDVKSWAGFALWRLRELRPDGSITEIRCVEAFLPHGRIPVGCRTEAISLYMGPTSAAGVML